jgi:hypothetical protein
MATSRLLPEEMLLRDRRPARSRVAIISAVGYSEGLADSLTRAPHMFRLNLCDKSVLLRPNFVEYIAGIEVNTNPVLVSAAAEAFRNLGARCVVAAEGPGHQRDTYLVLAESRLEAQPLRQKLTFVDLNRDELIKVATRANYTGLNHLWLPRTVLAADFVVSMPKIKTHHWAGVTLSMKNIFRHCAGNQVRLAEEYSSLERDPSQHSRYLRHRADSLRYRAWGDRHGGQRTAARNSSATRQDRSRQRSSCSGLRVCATDGTEPKPGLAS